MKRRRIFFGLNTLFFGFFIGSMAMAAPMNHTKEIKVTSPSKAIMVTSQKPEFTITLQSNATTGFSWFLSKYNRKLIEVVGQKYVAPNTKLMGAPGYDVWTFKALPVAFTVPQATRISLIYARPWVKHVGKASVFEVFFK